ncbi:MAG: peroxide stress protein YaaA, partial [Planctomycetota bacterium]
SADSLGDLMGISDKLATLNKARFKDWSPDPEAGGEGGPAVPAILHFRGDVYQGFDADSLDDAGLAEADRRVRILSGLYGLLRPLDAVRAYRLEMGTTFDRGRPKTLYEFWREKVTAAVSEEIAATGAKAVINLASNEYASAVDFDAISVPVVSPQFKEDRDGEPKMISFFAKWARGSMARYLVDSKADTPAALRRFRRDGYRYDKSLSTEAEPVFVRPDSRSAGER